MTKRIVETSVGIFMLLAVLALIFLALQVSGLSLKSFGSKNYEVSAVFTDIGSLRVRAPVRVAGVEIGNVVGISLDPKTFEAVVILQLHGNINDIPTDSSIKITSSGLLGDSYIALTPGYSTTTLHQGSVIETTYPATSLESLISTFMGGSKTNVQTAS
jgi:phospholipid/cholesterol/gamma-HCH transport system substrate-binding protein